MLHSKHVLVGAPLVTAALETCLGWGPLSYGCTRNMSWLGPPQLRLHSKHVLVGAPLVTAALETCLGWVPLVTAALETCLGWDPLIYGCTRNVLWFGPSVLRVLGSDSKCTSQFQTMRRFGLCSVGFTRFTYRAQRQLAEAWPRHPWLQWRAHRHRATPQLWTQTRSVRRGTAG